MSRGARSVAQTKARFTGPPAFPDSLLFSPHGEAKCVRGPSGLGASRAEEKGASRLARAGVLEQYVEHGKQAQRNHGGHIVCFDRRVVGNAGYSNPKPRPTVFHESRITSHETRLFFSVVRDGWRHRKPPSGPLPPPASRCFPVRHCSPLFTIVQQKNCSAPLPSRRPVAAFLRVVARHGAAMERHGRPPSPAPATRTVRFSRITRHETRDTAFMLFTRQESRNMDSPCPSGGSKESNPKLGQRVFHESRDTSHESRPLCFSSHDFPRFPTISRHFPRFPGPPHPLGKGPRAVQSLLYCALWRGMGRLWRGMGGRRLPRRQHGLWGFHQLRDTQHGFSLFLRRLQGEQPQARPTGFSRITNHETRITAFIRPPHPPGKGSPRRPPPLPPPPGCFRCGGREGAHSSRLHGKNASHLCWFVSIRGECTHAEKGARSILH